MIYFCNLIFSGMQLRRRKMELPGRSGSRRRFFWSSRCSERAMVLSCSRQRSWRVLAASVPFLRHTTLRDSISIQPLTSLQPFPRYSSSFHSGKVLPLSERGNVMTVRRRLRGRLPASRKNTQPGPDEEKGSPGKSQTEGLIWGKDSLAPSGEVE